MKTFITILTLMIGLNFLMAQALVEPDFSETVVLSTTIGANMDFDFPVANNRARSGPNTIIYVKYDATGMGDGTSWTDAFTSLHDALTSADSLDQVWVAQGVYKPETIDTPMISNFFAIDQTIELYGGFEGDEINLDERDVTHFKTILSGDINGDDVDGDFSMNKDDNVVHVLGIRAQNPIIDGFEIAYGSTEVIDPSMISGHQYYGGGIISAQPFILKNCVIRQNAGMLGGGLYAVNGPTMIEKCHFINNHSQYLGGGICAGNMDLVVDSCLFQMNFAETLGGGMIAFQNPGTTLDSSNVKLVHSTFTQNSSSIGGGIAYQNFVPGSKFIIDNCQLSKNMASNQGGGIRLLNVSAAPDAPQAEFSVNIIGSRLDSNLANLGAGIYFEQLSNESDITISNSIVDHNSNTEGGSLYFRSSNESDFKVVIKGCEMRSNQAISYAGAVVFHNNQVHQMKYFINDCVFSENDGGYYAGAIYSTFSEPTINGPIGSISNSTFLSNKAKISCGAISSNNEDLTVLQCTFESNTTENSASAICLTSLPNANCQQTIRNSQFKQNETTMQLDTSVWLNNGAVEIWSEGTQNVLVDSCLFDSNVSPQTAGAMIILNSDSLAVSVMNSSFNKNSSGSGGAIVALGLDNGPQPHVHFNNCEFLENNCSVNGGAVLFSNSHVLVEHSTFNKNRSLNGGGHIAASNGSNIIFEAVSVREGVARLGGGVATYNNNPASDDLNCQFLNCEFIENQSVTAGGACFLTSAEQTSHLLFDKCAFTSNESGEGGAIYAVTNSSSNADAEINLTVRKSDFELNVAQANGGAIYNGGMSDTLHFKMDSCTLRRNKTLSTNPGSGGGGILNAALGTGIDLLYEIKNTLFEENQSNGISGGLWNSGSRAGHGTKGNTINCRFINNSAKHCCGGLGVAFNEGLYDRCYFEGNVTEGTHPAVSGGGGAGFIVNKDVVFSNSVFKNNSSDVDGDAIYFANGGAYRMENMDIKDHNKTSAVYSDVDLDIVNSTLRDNALGLHSWTLANVNLQNSVFDNSINWTGVGTLTSSGSNISSDETMTSFLNVAGTYADHNDADPLLDTDGVPTSGSPCVDAGNPNGLISNTDVAGNARVQGNGVDIGAYESPYFSALENVEWNSSKLNVYPNPIEQELNFSLENSTQAVVDIFDAKGIKILSSKINSHDGSGNYRLNIGSIASGNYYLIVSEQTKAHAQNILIK